MRNLLNQAVNHNKLSRQSKKGKVKKSIDAAIILYHVPREKANDEGHSTSLFLQVVLIIYFCPSPSPSPRYRNSYILTFT